MLNIASPTSTDTQKFASCLELHIEIDNEERLQTKLYDKRDDFTFPIVNFPFTNNITSSAAYEVYNSLLMRYSRASAKYSDFLDRAIVRSS